MNMEQINYCLVLFGLLSCIFVHHNFHKISAFVTNAIPKASLYLINIGVRNGSKAQVRFPGGEGIYLIATTTHTAWRCYSKWISDKDNRITPIKHNLFILVVEFTWATYTYFDLA